MVVYVTKYNNYFNRIVRKSNDLNDYLSGDWEATAKANFNEGDGVSSVFVANTSLRGDYLIVTDDSMNILSRWFILSNKRMRNGQYSLSLRRDFLADYYDDYVNQPFYCEKATLPQTDPMIFNSENIQVNRIKQSETPLTPDDLGWIVGYTQIPADGLKADSINLDQSTDYISVASLDSWDYKDFMTTSAGGKPTKYLCGNLTMWLGGMINTNYIIVTDGIHKIYINDKDYAGDMTNTMEFVNKDSTKSLFVTYFNINNGLYDTTDIDGLDGRIIRESRTGKYYKVHFKFRTLNAHNSQTIKTDAGALYTELIAAMKADHPDDLIGELTALWYYNEAYMYLEETSVLIGDLKMFDNVTFLKKLNDADYCMFAIPCPQRGSTGAYSGYTYTYEKSMAIAQMLARQLQPSSAGGNLIDLQLLPYCPTKNGVNTKSTLDIYDGNGLKVGEVYCCKVSTFDLILTYSDSRIDIANYKLSSICDTYRLVSPNYSSTYEFSPAKNGGVKYWHINCTYKPYNPYINIHPHWAGLYGQDFDDNRGLILGGDYSLPLSSDAFETYQIQNKNYSAIFDRQLVNMDIQNGWNMASTITGAVAGTVQGAAMGAMAGPAGAIAGGVASAIGGAADIAQSAVMMKESKDMQKDMYSYQLGNIDSKPNTLVKSSAFDISYKMWPFVEYLTCTDIEREAVKSKLKYDGMTVNRIGKIEDFLGDAMYFIKGQLIRLDIGDDTHVANEIYAELAKGVYFE